MHSNPEASHLINELSLTPKINAVYSDIAQGLTTVFAWELARGLPEKGFTYKLLGVGSGACNLEIDIARIMVHHHFEKGERIRVYCYDPFNEGYASARASIHQVNSNTGSRVNFVAVQNLPTLVTFHGVFAHHSLHHVSDLEGLYEYIEKSMHIDGVFFATDMTGRNGNRRWPEQLALADKLWNEQPTPGHAWDYINNVALDEYPDYDYSYCNGQPGNNFEGIRSEEVPLLEQNFYFDKFVAFGGLSHEYVGRRLGDNYKTDTEEGRAFIQKLHELQESATNDNIIKPDQFFACMRRMDSKAKLDPPKNYGNIQSSLLYVCQHMSMMAPL